MAKRAHDLSWTIPRPGETVAGKYLVEGMCGRGGLAAVLSAMHVGLDQRVAIKMLLPEWADDPQVVERFLREGRAATRIRSEHVVRVFDVGTFENGAPYLVMEYLEGHNLDDVIAMWGPLPVATTVDWILQAAEAIAEAHAYGIVHRDLKPANLFLTRRADRSPCVKVLDFGLSKLTDPNMSGAGAKLTRDHDVLGSPHYMAPEQLRATRDADTPADVWALGAVLHELLTGQTPFRGETMPELCATVLTQPAPRLSSLQSNVPPEIEAAVLRCLEKEPEARFANLAELATAIAPFGTAAARESCARIERVLEGGARTSELSLPTLPPLPVEEPGDLAAHWPSDAYAVPRRGVVSLRAMLGAFLVLAGLGAAVLIWMYDSVHQDEPVRKGVTAAQPSRVSPAPGSAAVQAPAASTNASTPAPPKTDAPSSLAPDPAPGPAPAPPQPAPSPAEPSPARGHVRTAPAQARTPAAASGATHPQRVTHVPAPARQATPPPNPPQSLAPPSAPIVREMTPTTSPPPAAPAADDLFTGRK